MLTIERVDFMTEMISTEIKRVQTKVSIDVSVKHCSFWNTFHINHALRLVLSVEHEPEMNGRTDSPSNRFDGSLAIRMFPCPLIKY